MTVENQAQHADVQLREMFRQLIEYRSGEINEKLYDPDHRYAMNASVERWLIDELGTR